MVLESYNIHMEVLGILKVYCKLALEFTHAWYKLAWCLGDRFYNEPLATCS